MNRAYGSVTEILSEISTCKSISGQDKIKIAIMLKFSAFLFPLFLMACCGLHTEVIYRYKNITITRIDECGITSFYYENAHKKEEGRIWAKYSGINDGFSGYLIFENDKATILSGDGYFQSNNLDTNKFSYRWIVSYQRPILGDSVYYINFSTKYEIEDNQNSNTKIVAKYKIDDNEWW